MNNNKANFNKLLNHFKNTTQKINKKKSYTVFFVLIIFVILVLIIVIVRKGLNQMKILSREIKNTFFLEMLELKNPYDASEGNNKICIRGKKEKTDKIPSNKLGPKITDTYTLMFWVKISTSKFKDFDVNQEYPLVSLSDNENLTLCSGNNTMYPGFFIKPINNTLIVQTSDDSTSDASKCHKSEVYNFPYDEWTCISTFVTKSYINIYINGKLIKISEYDTLGIQPEKLDMYIGKYPGFLAFLSINKNPHFGSDGIYKEYLYYRNIIDIYEQSKYKNEYNYDRKQNPHKYKEFRKDFIKKKEDPNICK